MKLRHTAVCGLVILTLAVVCCPPLPYAKADKLFFGDGFVIEGQLKEKMTYLPGVGSTYKAGEPFWVDDGVRKIYFPPFHLKEALKDREKKADQVQFTLFSPKGTNPLPPFWAPDSATKWDAKMEREVTLDVDGRKLKVTQRITSLTPKSMRVESVYYDWTSSYNTKELSSETLRTLVYQFASKKKDSTELDRRMAVYRFMLQAGFTDEAEQELNGMRREFPNEDSKISPLLSDLKKIFALNLMEALERAQKAGLHHEVEQKLEVYAQKKLDDFLDEKAQLKVQAIKETIQVTKDKLKDAHNLLAEFAAKVDSDKREFFKRAAADIISELNPDTVERLETFLNLAADFKRAINDKRQPEQSPAEVMAFALTGWLRGSDAAEKGVDVAVKQWEARRLLLDYLRNNNAAVRKGKLLPALQEKISVDDAIQILKQLPPVEPLEKVSTRIEQMQSSGERKSVNYALQLPPRYHHGRTWPVLIVLHHGSEKPAEAVAKWSELAAQHGYIVAAPQWGKGQRNEYQFTSEEHATVLETLRDLRRRFQIDSDRVFLFGLEYGATMAFDVGFSHPDQFTGIIPMCGTPQYFAKRYWPNAQHLHMYVVNGERTSTSAKETLGMFKDYFLKYNYPGIYAEYKGRPGFFYVGEQPIIFDWMNRKRRAFPQKELGKIGQEFKTNRDGDRQFYWLTAANVMPNRINNAKNWNGGTLSGTLRATLFNTNEIHVNTTGVGPATVWFGPKFVNYAEKVAISYNGRTVVKHSVTPNLETLLEKLYETGDRQRLYFAKVELK